MNVTFDTIAKNGIKKSVVRKELTGRESSIKSLPRAGLTELMHVLGLYSFHFHQ